MLKENKNFVWTDIDIGLQKILKIIFPGGAYVTSAKRSVEQNKAVGGSAGSAHVDWDNDGDAEAVDIRRSSFSGSPEEKARQAYSEGATNVGIYNTHIHIDTKASRINNPYFKDNRTVFISTDESKKKITSFNYFKSFYNKELAIVRAGSTQVAGVNVDPVVNIVDPVVKKTFGYDESEIMAMGVALLTFLIFIGLKKEK